MSSRAIRALRGDAAIPEIPDTVSEDEEEAEEPRRSRPAAFALMQDDDESSTTTSEEEQEEKTDLKTEKEAFLKEDESKDDKQGEAAEPQKEEEDLDALLSEFREKDTTATTTEQSEQDITDRVSSPFDKILEGMDAKDLDYEYSLRTSLLDGGTYNPELSGSSSSNRRRKAPLLLFGPARDGWVRPPRHVGGGIGMSTYDRDPRALPWPYYTEAAAQDYDADAGSDDDGNTNKTFASQWCTFLNSDSYQRDVNDYHSVIEQSGDLNALVMFVVHHPFVTPALLQLSTVLYQTNHSQEGLGLLRRILWIYESSALIGFGHSIQDGKVRFMDPEQPENKIFFQALFRLMQVSNIAGLSRTAFAVTRLLLSMDPLRDPMHVLLVVDKFAMTVALNSSESETKKVLRWMIDLVESDLIQLWYRDMSEAYHCDVRNLPNWAYSYALALFHWYRTASLECDDNNDVCVELKEKANEALQAAMSRFPAVVGLLLQHLEVDTTGRSFRRDWVTVLDFATDRSRRLAREWHEKCTDTVTLSATMQACDLMIQIFVQTNSKLWGDEDVLQWVYDNLREMQSRGTEELPEAPSPAVMRYSGADPADFEDKIQQLPPEANIIDPGLVAHAMAMNPNRPRFLRHMQQRRGPDDPNGFIIDDNGNRVPNRRLMGPPTEVVDPDWPLLEVFWRSILPWNHVEGIPPPRR